MKALVNKYIICATGIILSVLHVFASDPASEFNRANLLYQQNSFDSAAAVYEQLITQQYLASEVYYNLGNCYYKTGNPAKAILNYERALKYRPGDEDILFNLKIAQLKTIDKIETVPEIFYVRWINKLSALFTPDKWSQVIVVFVWCALFSALVYLLSQRSSTKRAGFILTLIFLLLTFTAWALTRKNYIDNYVNKNAVVMSISVYVKSSPGENNTDLFLLHEGTTVSVLDEYEEWLKIKIANGGVGWLKRGDVEEI